MPNSVHARVTITLEIPVASVWGPTCNMKQISEQAITDVKGMLRNSKNSMMYGARIIGDPKVTAILATEE
jgi:hypothetical protein